MKIHQGISGITITHKGNECMINVPFYIGGFLIFNEVVIFVHVR
ncbi:hypothetical protein yrohd0001_34310 [Yersinia rohdei ATCC 43380]|nr:hypothetical protein yrohd0001_34310 [Yersinia rohdei ATCC 43380]